MPDAVFGRGEFIVVTMTTPETAELASVSLPNKREYCEKHGYKLAVVRPTPMPNVNVTWYKPLSILEYLPDANFVLWVDLDTLFMDMTRPLSDIVRMASQRNVLCAVTADQPYTLNAGVLAFRNCEWSMEFLATWWALRAEINHVWADNMGLIAMWSRDKWRKGCQTTEQKCLNAFDSGTQAWQEGYPILHLPGRGQDERVVTMRQYLTKVKR